MIDLRSDTVTRPTEAMRAAMAAAAVGDDVFGDDPTVNRLQAEAAALVGKEAALFVPSGTMGNLIALLAHCQRGQEALIGDESHIYHYEAGGASALGGVVYHPVATNRWGELPLEALQAAIRPAHDPHAARAGVICLESSHNRCGGTVPRLEYMAQVRALGRERGLPVHLDGARMFNAAVALGVPVTAITEQVDTVQFCLSKGLRAPIGSLLAGPAEFIERAHRLRKMVGGGMRQVGVIAAAGLIALHEMPARLSEDHANARMLAEALAAIPAIEIDLESVQTNIVVFKLRGERSVAETLGVLKERGVALVAFKDGLRAVTHGDISTAACEQAAAIIAAVLGSA